MLWAITKLAEKKMREVSSEIGSKGLREIVLLRVAAQIGERQND